MAVSSRERIEDPLLDLAIAEEKTDDYETLMKLATSALAVSEASAQAMIDPKILEQFSGIKLPSSNDKPSTVKKQYLIESSDTDFGSGFEIVDASH